MQRRLATMVFLGWAVLYSRHGSQWQQVADTESLDRCEQVRSMLVGSEATREMDDALEMQAPDNPMRMQGFARAARRVAARYRCQEY